MPRNQCPILEEWNIMARVLKLERFTPEQCETLKRCFFSGAYALYLRLMKSLNTETMNETPEDIQFMMDIHNELTAFFKKLEDHG